MASADARIDQLPLATSIGDEDLFVIEQSSAAKRVKGSTIKASGTKNYNDLNNKPSINGVSLNGNKTAAQLGITVPTKTSQLTNDSGFLTSHQSLSGYATEDWVEDQGYLTEHNVFSATANTTTYSQINSAVLQKKSVICYYNSRLYTLASISSERAEFSAFDGTSNIMYLIRCSSANAWTSLSFSPESTLKKTSNWHGTPTDVYYPTEKLVYDSLEEKVNKPSAEGSAGQVLATYGDGTTYWKTVSGGGGGGTSDYTDLENKPQINGVTLTGNKTLASLGINIPTKTSDLTNDSGFLTSHQSLAGYATESWVENKGYLTQHQDITGKLDKYAGTQYSGYFLSVNAQGNIVPTQLPTYNGEVV